MKVKIKNKPSCARKTNVNKTTKNPKISLNKAPTKKLGRSQTKCSLKCNLSEDIIESISKNIDQSVVEKYKKWRQDVTVQLKKFEQMSKDAHIDKQDDNYTVKNVKKQVFWNSPHLIIDAMDLCVKEEKWDHLVEFLLILLRHSTKHLNSVKEMVSLIIDRHPKVKLLELETQLRTLFQMNLSDDTNV